MSDVRNHILDAVKHLAEYNLDVWKQVGPGVQASLVDYLAVLSEKELADIRPLAIAVWREALDSEIKGATWRADSVIFRRGAIAVSEPLVQIRDKAIRGLFQLFLGAKDDAERHEVTSALDTATRMPTQAQYDNELLSLSLRNAREIVEFYTAHKDALSFELSQHLEHQFFLKFRRAKHFIEDKEGRFNVQEVADALCKSIVSFSRGINENPEFVRYKVLVGFESVYPGHWSIDDFDFKGSEVYRNAEAQNYIQDVSPKNEDDWFSFVERCAGTKSNDLATFPVFAQFLAELAAAKPAIAYEWLRKASSELLAFLPAFLRGLARSYQTELYYAAIDEQLARATNLAGVARHLLNDESIAPNLPGRVLEIAIEKCDDSAVVETFIVLMEKWNSSVLRDQSHLLDMALKYLTDREITYWVSHAWFRPGISDFLASIDQERTKRILDNLLSFPKADYQLEHFLEKIPKVHIGLLWDFLCGRLSREKPDDGSRYEAIPYDFHGLKENLSRDPALALQRVQKQFEQDRVFFRFNGGRLLSIAFPDCPEPFAAELVRLVEFGTGAEADFVLDIVQNYHGEESTHEILKQVIVRYSDDAQKLSKVRISFDNAGVVSGEFGTVEAYRNKRALLQAWLSDPRSEIRTFAELHIKELELQIAFEQKRAEERSALRRLDFKEIEGDEG